MASVLTQILGGLLGAMASGMVSGGTPTGGLASSVLGAVAPGTVSDYPSDVPIFDYNVTLHPGPPFNNASLNRADAQLASRMQTLDEHNRALNKYMMKNMDPMQRRWAIQKGKEEEARLPSFWKYIKPRRTLDAGSSAVSGIKINGDNTISVQFGGKGKWYTYRGGPNRFEASLAAKDLITAPSIGRAINSKNGWWGTTHKLF